MMKFLLVFLVVLVIAWRWRTWRETIHREKKKTQSASGSSSEMIPCRQCGVHLPANEAVVGKLGSYCSHDHRYQVEH
jgi:uncharacterized protein